MTNYQKQYGITLKQAKLNCKDKLDRLIRPGYEILVHSYPDKIKSIDGTFWYHGKREIYLVNSAGKFYLYDYFRD